MEGEAGKWCVGLMLPHHLEVPPCRLWVSGASLVPSVCLSGGGESICHPEPMLFFFWGGAHMGLEAGTGPSPTCLLAVWADERDRDCRLCVCLCV